MVIVISNVIKNIVKFRLKNFSSAYIYNILIVLAVMDLLNLNIKK